MVIFNHLSGRQWFERNAMRIGQYEHVARVAETHWAQFARDVGLPGDVICDLRGRNAEALPDTFRTLFDGEAPAPARDRLLSTPLLSRMQAPCTAAHT
ncbi:hypothetical protein AUL38_07980 [Leucobacter sp. G161]|nr:hypothetical protein AUL38_07980 [Leucobacter sp. G161]